MGGLSGSVGNGRGLGAQTRVLRGLLVEGLRYWFVRRGSARALRAASKGIEYGQYNFM